MAAGFAVSPTTAASHVKPLSRGNFCGGAVQSGSGVVLTLAGWVHLMAPDGA